MFSSQGARALCVTLIATLTTSLVPSTIRRRPPKEALLKGYIKLTSPSSLPPCR